ncbi:armadillo-type protein [Suillus clintonianus]|uniref:armadillo-type protein n=1 Tax=Suillus clintonianus TaxID=1904413 RepID=UPI001B86737D|nr:armadillo-type protein [Suillus clintonianus]KAG2148028.1 armadillo-type protein [Suillus clintonianus]
MPNENRKRGKKHKKTQEHSQPSRDTGSTDHAPQNSERPSWIVPAQESEEDHSEAPFGYVDPDIKAYFRTVDDQIRTWQQERPYEEDQAADLDPNEAKRIFLVAALTEMSEKEKQLATDPDCSVVLERMAYSMDDFVRRVFLDSLSGSYEALIKHRFASHVCQTLFTVAADTVTRETKGIYPSVADSKDKGELRTLTRLILDICEELTPVFTSLVMDPFASHVLRALLLLLSPSSSATSHKAQSNMRSKKSSAWKARQGTMKSVFADNKSHDHVNSTRSVPKEFHDAATRFVRVLKSELSDNEVRALAANKVASPLLQLILEVEADHGESSLPDSLMDRVLVGIITLCHRNPDEQLEASDYLVTLLRDPTSSHLLETMVSRCPDPAFTVLWATYFRGKLARLATHPVANFVVAKAAERLNPAQLKVALEELESSWSKVIASARTGVLRAMIDRACKLRVHETDICQAVCSTFELLEPKDRNHLVSCVLVLKPLREYMAPGPTKHSSEDAQKSSKKGNMDDSKESKVQGALILQSLLRLSEPHCMIVTESIKSLPTEDLILLSHNPISSRVIDVLFESETVPFKVKRTFVMSLIGHYHTLVDDRIGSRVGDRCWAFADPYLREKIARSLIVHEQFLAASYFGKYFARNINLYLLQRRPEEWRELQSQSKSSSGPITSPSSLPSAPSQAAQRPNSNDAEVSHLSKSSKKRRSRPEDEIDAVFNASLGTKVKRTAVSATDSSEKLVVQNSMDQGLQDVLGAIRAAPGDDSSRGKRQRKC